MSLSVYGLSQPRKLLQHVITGQTCRARCEVEQHSRLRQATLRRPVLAEVKLQRLELIAQNGLKLQPMKRKFQEK